ncbi:MAG: IS630 family transposase [Gammaproteobacteria bacterium]|jgi:transposase
MEKFHLSEKELMELHESFSRAKKKSAKHAYKINVIILLATGWTIETISAALLISDETIRKYKKAYQKGGIKKLLNTNYAGSDCKLTAHQMNLFCKELDSNIYLTTNQVIEYVEKYFGVTYSVSGMNQLLHRLNYTYKKPKLVPGKSDIEKQTEFVELYEEFMENKPKNEAVYFMDGVHPEHNTLAAYGWIRKGEERKLLSNSGRQRVNLHGAINIETLEVDLIEGKKVNGESTVELLKLIEKSCPNAVKIHVILDNAKYHYSKFVKKYVTSSRINLVFLPTYSPNLNLIERLWKLFKKKTLYNRYYEKFKDVKDACMNFFINISEYDNEIRSLMSEEFHMI